MPNFRNEELYSWEADGNNYTLKVYRREDCRYYSILVYEDENEAKVVFTSKPNNSAAKAKEDARKYLNILQNTGLD